MENSILIKIRYILVLLLLKLIIKNYQKREYFAKNYQEINVKIFLPTLNTAIE